MKRRVRIVAWGAMLLGNVLLATAVVASVSQADEAGHRGVQTITDAVGDVLGGASESGDIVSTKVEYGPHIALAVQARQPIAPLDDSTLVLWELDTTGDGKIDYKVQTAAEHEPRSFVSRPGEAATVCDAKEGDDAVGHRLVVDPKCVGNPVAISYRVSLVKRDPVTIDASPNEGMAGPVTPVAPPTPRAPPSPPSWLSVTSPPTEPVSPPSAPTSVAPPAPPGGLSVTPPPAGLTPPPPPSGLSVTPPSQPSAPPPPALTSPPATSPAPNLARTGPSEVAGLAGAGVAFIALGLGLSLTSRQRTQSASV